MSLHEMVTAEQLKARVPAQLREMDVRQIAIAVAPAFRDKFDFSNQGGPHEASDYDKLADHAYLAAEALLKKHEARMIAARAKDDAANKETSA